MGPYLPISRFLNSFGIATACGFSSAINVLLGRRFFWVRTRLLVSRTTTTWQAPASPWLPVMHGRFSCESFSLLLFVHSSLIVVMMGDFRRTTAGFRIRLGHFLVFRRLPLACHAHNAIPDSPNNHARNESEQRGHDQE